MNQPACIGILTGGGDCPGLNAVIRSVVQTAVRHYGARVLGIEDGFEGLVEGRMRELTLSNTEGILPDGGTILGTSNKGDPWHYHQTQADGSVVLVNCADRMLANARAWGLDCLIVVGGDGTMQLAGKFAEMGIPIVGVPKTIDNDLAATDQTFGFDTATAAVCEALDKLATTASSHHRVMVVEVMGRSAGWIALWGGLAGAADVILLPEVDWDWAPVCDKVKARHEEGMRYSLLCVAEGAKLPGKGEQILIRDERLTDPVRLGGIGSVVAREIEARTGLEARVTVLGHLQRGGSPTSFDRVLSIRFGTLAAACACTGKTGVMVSLKGAEVVTVPITDALAPRKVIPVDHPVLQMARQLGVCLGDI
ncbi:6-phosphofructokinase [Leeia oryzae]|uniref:6-phosphofructokinase n=1 Tax=Leeia oryzae TaxID=356662 RepID=UPI00035DC5AF|nr:ATP-dependent 6-phosphofructokinase [Leeia oryzae]